jgi:hypothetical protein
MCLAEELLSPNSKSASAQNEGVRLEKDDEVLAIIEQQC